MFVRVSFIYVHLLASYLRVEKYPPAQSRRLYKHTWPDAQISAQRRAHTCHDQSARALGALPCSPACSDARVRSAYALTTPLHTTSSFTTAHLPRCAQRCSRAVLVKEIDDELFDVLELPHGDHTVAHRIICDNGGATIVSATFTSWCRRLRSIGQAGTSEASPARLGCTVESGSTVHCQRRVCASFCLVSRSFVLRMYFHFSSTHVLPSFICIRVDAKKHRTFGLPAHRVEPWR